MRKLTKRSTPFKKKVKLPQHVEERTATEGSENSIGVLTLVSKKSPSFLFRNESGSWAEQSGTTTLSWPEDMEEVATKRVVQQWETVERTLYEENDQLPLGPAFDECLQWQNQLPHLRLVGKNLQKETEEPASKPNSSLKRKQPVFEIEETEEITSNNDLLLEDSDDSTSESHKRAREDVIDELMEYVNSALVLRENIAEEDMLSRDLEEFLTITPAPTNNFRSTITPYRHSQRDNDFQRCSSGSNKTSSKVVAEQVREQDDPFWDLRSAICPRFPENVGNETSVEDERPVSSQLMRNKAGMVFSEKVVVSPVPFVRSTRESFCTLQTAPIQILGQATSTTWNRGTGRTITSGRRLTSGRKTSLMRSPQVHSAWQPPVCPTIWPKNVRLAPIDSTRLPNSKQRTISTAVPQRGRGSLSPIFHSTLSASMQSSNSNSKEILEIHGTHIAGQSQKGDELKSNLNQASRIKSNGRKKARHKVELL